MVFGIVLLFGLGGLVGWAMSKTQNAKPKTKAKKPCPEIMSTFGLSEIALDMSRKSAKLSHYHRTRSKFWNNVNTFANFLDPIACVSVAAGIMSPRTLIPMFTMIFIPAAFMIRNNVKPHERAITHKNWGHDMAELSYSFSRRAVYAVQNLHGYGKDLDRIITEHTRDEREYFHNYIDSGM